MYSIKILLAVGLGSFVGGIFRYIISVFIQSRHQSDFPYGTWAVNIVGCFIIGLIFAFVEKGFMNTEWRLFLIAGVLGGFTTFSAFSLESVLLFKQQSIFLGLIYILSSVALGLISTLIGYSIIKYFN